MDASTFALTMIDAGLHPSLYRPAKVGRLKVTQLATGMKYYRGSLAWIERSGENTIHGWRKVFHTDEEARRYSRRAYERLRSLSHCRFSKRIAARKRATGSLLGRFILWSGSHSTGIRTLQALCLRLMAALIRRAERAEGLR